MSQDGQSYAISRRHLNQQNQPRTSSQPRDPVQQRREFLWRERVKLEIQQQALAARANALRQQWQLLQHKKTQLAQQKGRIAAHILLSGLVRERSVPGERLFHSERARIAQEEERLQEAMLRCRHDDAALQAQLGVIDVERSFL